VAYALLALSTLLSASDIMVHLINARTGKPIADKPVRMWFQNPPSRQGGYLEERTGTNGVAVFHLKDPLPSSITVHLGMGGYWEECPPNNRAGFDVKEILQSGVAREGACPPHLQKIDQKFTAKPGELYLFASHLTVLERMTDCNELGCR
jgi:hypothetical protein